MSFFFFNDTATTEIYTLSLHDALPISGAEEHDGDLLDMPAIQLLNEAIEENIDQFVYLTTLRDAIRDHGLMVESTAAGFVESESTAGDKYYGGTD